MSSRSPRLEGATVRLRGPEALDRAARKALGFDPAFMRGVGGVPRDAAMSDDEVDAWFAALDGDPYFWIIEAGGTLIGNARIRSVDLDRGAAFFTIGIFSAAHRGRGLGTEATQLVVRFAFETLGVSRVELRVLASNGRAIRCYERAGFTQEAIDRDAECIDGQWHDEILMSIHHPPNESAAPVTAKRFR